MEAIKSLDDFIEAGIKLKIPADQLAEWSEKRYNDYIERQTRAEERELAKQQLKLKEIEAAAQAAQQAADMETRRLKEAADMETRRLKEAADMETKRLQEAADMETKRLQEAADMETKRLQEAANIEIEKQKKLAEIETAKADKEATARQDELKMQIRLKELEVQQPSSAPNEGAKPKENKVNRFKGLIKPFASGDNISAWTQNFEMVMAHYHVPHEEWCILYISSLSGEPLRLTETIPDDIRTDYEQVKGRILQHYQLDQEGFRQEFAKLKPKTTQTFIDYASACRDTFRKWVKAAKITTFEELQELMIRDKILASIPPSFAKFLQESDCTSLAEIEKKGTAFYNANRDIFAITEDNTYGAAANDYQGRKFPSKQRKWTSNRWVTCRYCQNQHQEHEMCDKNPGYQEYLRNTLKRVQDRSNRYRKALKCHLCRAIGHLKMNCEGKRILRQANASEVYASSSDSEGEASINSAGAVQNIDMYQLSTCEICRQFHNEGKMMCGHPVPTEMMYVNSLKGFQGKLNTHKGYVNGRIASVLRDSGATIMAVRQSLVNKQDYTGEYIRCKTFAGTIEKYPLAWAEIRTPFITGRVKCAAVKDPCCDIIIGNSPQVKECSIAEVVQWNQSNLPSAIANSVTNIESQEDDNITINAITRARAKVQQKEEQIENIEHVSPIRPTRTETREIFIQNQRADKTLQKCFELVDKKPIQTQHASWSFKLIDGILTREYVRQHQTILQTVLPESNRVKALQLAHDSPFAGHMATAKTKFRLLNHFYWPGFCKTIKDYCRSCPICQHLVKKGKKPKAQVQPTDLATRPFQKLATDIVGPLNHVTSRGNRFILTMVDFCTRWPEAIPMKTITSRDVTQVFINVFSRIGFPVEILSDRGTQFISAATQAVTKMFGIKQRFTAPYNPPANGICEKLNGDLKQMLAKVTEERPSDWDSLLPAILFAYREVPNNTGFSPFELVYGANPRGPLSIYNELITGNVADQKTSSAYELVTNLRDKIMYSCNIAKKALERTGKLYRHYANRIAKTIELEPGQKVLLLLPDDRDLLAISWQGPFRVVERISDVDYKIEINGKQKIYHINMLRPYFDRQETDELEDKDSTTVASLVDQTDTDNSQEIAVPTISDTTDISDIKIAAEMTERDKKQAEDLIIEYADIFSNKPGRTNIIEHDIVLTTDMVVRTKPYKTPIHYKEKLVQEIVDLEKAGIIQRSTSSYCSPIVLVKKKDNTIRLCVDYRKLNAITQLDPEPIPDTDGLIEDMTHARIFSKLDLTKGYWQIPMTKRSIHLTAFGTPIGLYEWLYLPFGLTNAPATFVRMTRQLLTGIPQIATYIDDICIYTATWTEHLDILRQVFDRIRQAGLTVKPSKVEIGCPEIDFLGHRVKDGQLYCDNKIVTKILNLQLPKTKKEVRSLLGLVNYYRKFIPHFAELTYIFTTLLAGGKPSKNVNVADLNFALSEIKSVFSNPPVLKLPNKNLPFTIRCDASGIAISAVLLQTYDNLLHPVMYVSRKLSTAETRYTCSERECLALIYAVTKLRRYLLGTHFTLETDNSPLLVLKTGKTTNHRIARWSLLLQDYSFQIKHIPGKDNTIADLLSRIGRYEANNDLQMAGEAPPETSTAEDSPTSAE